LFQKLCVLQSIAKNLYKLLSKTFVSQKTLTQKTRKSTKNLFLLTNYMKKKNIFFPCIIAGFFFSILSVSAFSDVPPSHRFSEEIKNLEGTVLEGYEDGTYRPERKINRAEFTKIVISHFDFNEIESCDTEKHSFPDVPKNEWFTKYVCLAKEKGVVKGYTDGTFRPSSNITLPEAIKIITRAYYAPVVSEKKEEGTYPWYRDYLKYFLENFRFSLEKFPELVNLSTISKDDLTLEQIEEVGKTYEITRGEMAHFITTIEMRSSFMCTQIYEPVCAEVLEECPEEGSSCGTVWQDFPNSCEAGRAGANRIIEGTCSEKDIVGGDNTSGSDGSSLQILIVPSYDEIPPSCKSWFDGCNTCGVRSGKVEFCTKMACHNETGKADAYCKEYK
jgi:hypothetical protein